MGWVIGWTACAPLATDKFREWCDSHGTPWLRHPRRTERMRLPIHPPCKAPVCSPPCGLHRVCPYEQSAARKRYRQRLRAGQVVGPLDEMSGKWARDVEGWEPWGREGSGDEG